MRRIRCVATLACGRQRTATWMDSSSRWTQLLDGRTRSTGMRASVLGAGGAARAVIVALMSRGAVVTVHARRSEQARKSPRRSARTSGRGRRRRDRGICWSIARRSAARPRQTASPLPEGPFDGRAVYDLTYGREMSATGPRSQRAGCVTLDGLPMLVAQAERQFEWWTGQRPPAGVMKAAALSERVGKN